MLITHSCLHISTFTPLQSVVHPVRSTGGMRQGNYRLSMDAPRANLPHIVRILIPHAGHPRSTPAPSGRQVAVNQIAQSDGPMSQICFLCHDLVFYSRLLFRVEIDEEPYDQDSPCVFHESQLLTSIKTLTCE